MKIKILVPKGKEKWKVIRKMSRYHRANVNTALKLTERLINEATDKEKTCVRVNYNDGYNETLMSQDATYLMYTTSCFLEDYLSPRTMNKYEKSIHI